MSAGCIQSSVIARLPYTNDAAVVNADLVSVCDSLPRRGEPFALPLVYTIKKPGADGVADPIQLTAYRVVGLLSAPCSVPLSRRSGLRMKDYFFRSFSLTISKMYVYLSPKGIFCGKNRWLCYPRRHHGARPPLKP
jgi:hypothetical protein